MMSMRKFQLMNSMTDPYTYGAPSHTWTASDDDYAIIHTVPRILQQRFLWLHITQLCSSPFTLATPTAGLPIRLTISTFSIALSICLPSYIYIYSCSPFVPFQVLHVFLKIFPTHDLLIFVQYFENTWLCLLLTSTAYIARFACKSRLGLFPLYLSRVSANVLAATKR